MNSPLQIVVLSASSSKVSKSVALARTAVDMASDRWHCTAQYVDVYHIGPELTSAIMRDDVGTVAEHALESVEHADLLIVTVPVYRGSYPGMFKHFMDLIDQHALNRTPVILMATGGSPRHTLVIDHELRPLLMFFHAFVAPTGVYASSADFDGTTILNPDVVMRVHRAVDDVAALFTGVCPGIQQVLRDQSAGGNPVGITLSSTKSSTASLGSSDPIKEETTWQL